MVGTRVVGRIGRELRMCPADAALACLAGWMAFTPPRGEFTEIFRSGQSGDKGSSPLVEKRLCW